MIIYPGKMEKSRVRGSLLLCASICLMNATPGNSQPFPPPQTTTAKHYPIATDLSTDPTRTVTCDFTDPTSTCGWSPAGTEDDLAFTSQTKVLDIEPLNPAAGPFLAALSSDHGLVARIASMSLTGTTERLLQFDYTSVGRGARSLRVFISYDENVLGSDMVFSYEDFGSGRPWKTAVATFTPKQSPYRIVIEAKFVLKKSAIAIDSVKLGGEGGTIVVPIAPEKPPARPVLTAVLPGGTCNFDAGLCPGWTATVGLGTWYLADTSSEPPAPPPQSGYGYMATSGAWLYGGTADLISQDIVITTKTFGQVAMWYHIFSTEVPPAEPKTTSWKVQIISVSANGVETVIDERTDTVATAGWIEWRSKQFCLTSDSKLKFVLAENSYAGFGVAVDEIVAERLETASENPTCEETAEEVPEDSVEDLPLPGCITWSDHSECMFESATDCGDFSSPVGSSKFVRQTGASGVAPYQIKGSLNENGEGYALAACSPDLATVGLVLPEFVVPPTTTVYGRVSFWYVHVGVLASPSFKLQQTTSSDPKVIWTTSRGQSSQWRHATVHFVASETTSLQFIAETDCTTPTAIDEVTVESGTVTYPCTSHASCDFESDFFCAWDAAEDFPSRWKIGPGPVGTGDNSLPGPPATGGANFAYIESNLLPYVFQPVELDSRVLVPVDTTMTFWYRATGAGVESFNLLMEVRGARYLLWTPPTADDSDWKEASVGICSTHGFKLIFETRFKELNLVVGLDGIVLGSETLANPAPVPAECPALEPYKPNPVPTKPDPPKPTPVYLPEGHIGNLYCDFEEEIAAPFSGLCNWRNLNLQDHVELTWVATPQTNDIPAYSGEQLLLAKTGSTPTSTIARLISPNIEVPGNTDGFFTLWISFKTSSQTGATLKVYLATADTMPTTPIWTSSHARTGIWHREAIGLDFKDASRRQVIIEADFTVRNGFITIDELELVQEPSQLEFLSCSFDNGICPNWESVPGKYRWRTRSIPQTGGLDPESGKGYVFVNNVPDDSESREVAELRTGLYKSLPGVQPKIELDAWFFSGPGRFTVELSIEIPNEKFIRPLITLNIDRPDTKWAPLYYPPMCLPTKTGTRFVLTIKPGPGFTFAALDEVKTSFSESATEGYCSEEFPVSTILSCDFNGDLCGWASSEFFTAARLDEDNKRVQFALASGTPALYATLTSHHVFLTKSTQITFRYNLFDAAGIDWVYIGTYANAMFTPLWGLTSSEDLPSNTWLPARAAFCEEGSFVLEIRVKFKPGSGQEPVRGRFGLDDLVINDETTALGVTGTPELECSPLTTMPTTITCSLPNVPTPNPPPFCGWQNTATSPGVTVTVGYLPETIVGGVWYGQSGGVFLTMLRKPEEPTVQTVVFKAEITVPDGPKAAELTFWYQLRGGQAQLTFTIQEGTVDPVNLKTGTTNWIPHRQSLAPGKTYEVTLTVTFPASEPPSKLDDVTEFFALDNVWYDAEPGYSADPIPEPKQEVFPAATCNFDAFGRLCSGWTATTGLGQWVGADNTKPPGPQAGAGYMFTNGEGLYGGTAELITRDIPVPSGERIYAEVSSWMHVFSNIDPPTQLPEDNPYVVQLVAVSQSGESVVVEEVRDVELTGGWVEWKSKQFCMTSDTRLKFVVVKSPVELSYAIDEVVTSRARQPDPAAQCPAAAPDPEPIPDPPPLPACMDWIVQSSLSCSFETATDCQDFNAPQGYSKFKHKTGVSGVPPHTINAAHAGNGDGYALATCAENPPPQHAAALILHDIPTATPAEPFYGRVTFWYVHVGLLQPGRSLSLVEVTPTVGGLSGRTLWDTSTGQSTVWKEATVDFIATEKISLWFIVETDCSTPTALDEVKIYKGAPSFPCVSCTFEDQSFCNWGKSDNLPNRWKIGTGQVGTGDYALDSTHAGGGGYFGYVDSDSLPYVRLPVELASGVLPPAETELSFWYRIYGDAVHLRLLLETGGDRFRLWQDLTSEEEWQEATVTICSTKHHKLIFEARFTSANLVVGLDSIELAGEDLETPPEIPAICPAMQPYVPQPAPPPTMPDPPALDLLPEAFSGRLSCDFEGLAVQPVFGLCDWRTFHLRHEEYSWTATPQTSELAAPSGKQFMLAAAIDPPFWPPSTRALAISPNIELSTGSDGQFTLQFNYLVSGPEATINIYLVSADVMPTIPAWSSASDLTPMTWHQAERKLDFGNAVRRQVLIEAKLAVEDSFSAIDNIVLAEEPQVVELLSCNFDRGIFCASWSALPSRYTWRTRQRPFGALSAAAGSNGFAYVNEVRDESQSQNNAVLESGLYRTPPGLHPKLQVNAWLYNGEGEVTVELYLTSPSMDEATLVYSRTMKDTGKWEAVEVPPFCMPKKSGSRYQFIIKPGAGFKVACLDEVETTSASVSEGYCPIVLSCDFNDDLCDWTNTAFDTAKTGTGAEEIQYALATSAKAPQASLTGPQLFITKATQMTFYYNLCDPAAIEVVEVGTESNGVFTSLWRLVGKSDLPANTWLPARVVVCSEGFFALQIKVTFRTNSEGPPVVGRFGLDNLVINNEYTTLSISGTPSFTCPPFTTMPMTTTCSLPNVLTPKPNTFCAWRLSSSSGTAMNIGVLPSTITEGETEGQSGAVYLTVLPLTAAQGTRSAVIRAEISTAHASSDSELTFWYQLRGGRVQLTANDGTVTTAQLNIDTTSWTPIAHVLEPNKEYTVTLAVNFPPTTGADQYFAVDNVWHSSEPGYAPDSMPGSIFSSASCNFDQGFGLCKGWTATMGLGQWVLGNSASKPQPYAGDGFMYTHGDRLYGGSAELITTDIVVPHGSDPIYAEITCWMNVFTVSDTPVTIPDENAYLVQLVAVSLSGETRVIEQYSDTDVTRQWVEWKSQPFCMTFDTRLKFVVVKSPPELSYAIDEIVTRRTTPDETTVCESITPPVPEIPVAEAAPLPGCLTWSTTPIQTCTFESAADCGNLEAPAGHSQFIRKTDPTGTAPFLIPGASPDGGSGYALGCEISATPTDQTVGLALPEIVDPTPKNPFYGRVTFWYVHVGVIQPTHSLKLVQVTGQPDSLTAHIIWATSRGQSSQWRHATVDFMTTQRTTLYFSANTDCTTPIALDEITVHEGTPEFPCVSCSFDDPAREGCAWDGVPSRWRIGTGSVGTGDYALPGAQAGTHFFYADSNTLPYPSLPAELDSRFLAPVKTTMTFWYRTYGYGVYALNLLIEIRGQRYVVWDDKEDSEEWKQATVEICSTQRHKLIFEARFTSPNFVAGLDTIVLASEALSEPEVPPTECPELEIYLPDLTPEPEKPPPPDLPEEVLIPEAFYGKISCDFEEEDVAPYFGLCGWQNLNLKPEREFFWTATAQIDELKAHTGERFMMAKQEVLAPPAPAPTRALVISPNIELPEGTDGKFTLQFQYRLSGRGASITIFIVTNEIMPEIAAWSTGSSPEPNKWHTANVQLDFQTSTRRQIIIQSRFTTAKSFAAIDAVVLIGETTNLDFLSCSFDAGLCPDWTNLPGQYRWTSRSRPQTGALTPYGGNGYAYVNRAHDDTETIPAAILQSGLYKSSPGIQSKIDIDAWFFLGAGKATVELYLISPNVKGSSRLFSAKVEAHTEWMSIREIYNMPFCLPTKTGTQYRIMVMPGTGFTFAALDELKTTRAEASDGTCPEEFPLTTTLSCDFNGDLCGWAPSGFTLSGTDGGLEGTEFAVAVSTASTKHATLSSHQVSLTKRTQLTFSYNLYNASKLEGVYVGTMVNGQFTVRWSLNANSHLPSNTWMPTRINLCTEGTFALEIVVIFKADSEATGKFGIDDIVIQDETTALSTTDSPTFVCPAIPTVPTTTTCSLDSVPTTPPTTYCGWVNTGPPGDTVSVIGDGLSSIVGGVGQSSDVYLTVTPLETVGRHIATIQDTIATPEGTSTLTFWYRLRGGECDFTVNGAEGASVTDQLRVDTTTWVPYKHEFTTQDVFTVTFNVRLVITAIKSVDTHHFALDNVWYDAESGFNPDPIPEPTMPILPSVTCDFDDGLCTGWSADQGVGRWELGGATDEPKPHDGEGFMYTEGGWLSGGSADLVTAEVVIAPNQALHAQVTLWINVFKFAIPGPPTAVLNNPSYVLKLYSISWFGGIPVELAKKDGSEVTNGWIELKTEPFCMTSNTRLVFKVEKAPHDLNFAIDTVITRQTRKHPATQCEVVTPPLPEEPTEEPGALPACLEWEAQQALSCSFESATDCQDFKAPDGHSKFEHKTGPSGVPPYVISGAHPIHDSKTGYALATCPETVPANHAAGLVLPDILGGTVAAPFYGRVSFWYVHIGFLQPADSLKLVQITGTTGDLKTTTIWTASASYLTRWRQATVEFVTTGTSTLQFIAKTDCNTPTALDEVIIDKGTPKAGPCVSCTFENQNFCSWGSQEELPVRWKLGTGTVGTGDNQLDGTHPSGDLYFAYADSSTLDHVRHTAEFDSTILPPVDTTMKFWYHTHGGTTKLSLLMEKGGVRSLIWDTLNSGSVKEWRQATVIICSVTRHRLIFEASFGEPNLVIGLDTIKLASEDLAVPAQPPTECPYLDPYNPELPIPETPEPVDQLPDPFYGRLNCDFEQENVAPYFGLCDWKSFDPVDGLFQMTVVPQTSQLKATSGEQLLVADDRLPPGYLDWFPAPPPPTKVLLISPSIELPPGAEGKYILRFDYRVSSADASLSIFLMTTNAMPTTTIWSSAPGLTPNIWHQGEVKLDFGTASRRQVIIQSVLAAKNVYSALDNIVLDEEPKQLDLLSCNFDSGYFCPNWITAPSQYTWRTRQRPFHYTTVPAADGTNGYAFVNELKEVTQTRQHAELRTGLYKSPRGSQPKVTLYASFYGQGTLTVKLVSITPALPTKSFTLLTQTVPNTHGWIQIDQTFCLPTKTGVQFAVEIIPGPDFKFAALDEVRTVRAPVSEGFCAEDAVAPPPVTTTLTCDFDGTLCGWSATGFVVNGADGFASVPPAIVAVATLTSHKVSLTKRTQLTFNYNLFDASAIESVSVGTLIHGDFTPLWSLSAGTGLPSNQWIPARVSLCLSGTFELQAKAEFKNLFTGNFGIDKIVINDEDTALSTTADPTLVCPPITVIPTTITCVLESTPTVTPTAFCGWAKSESTTSTAVVAVSRLPTAIDEGDYLGQSSAVYLNVRRATTPSEDDQVAIIESHLRTAVGDADLSFYYQIRYGSVTLTVTPDGQPRSPVMLPSDTTSWTPFVYNLKASSVPVTVTFTVTLPPTPDQPSPFDDPVIPYFALDSVWYSGEAGFIPDVIPPMTSTAATTTEVTTTGPTVPTDPTVPTGPTPPTDPTAPTETTPTGGSTTTGPTAPSTTPGKTGEVTTPSGLTNAEKVYIAGGCVAGALLVFFVVFFICYRRNHKRRVEEKNRKELNQREVELMDVPPVVAHVVRPPVPKNTAGSSNGLDNVAFTKNES